MCADNTTLHTEPQWAQTAESHSLSLPVSAAHMTLSVAFVRDLILVSHKAQRITLNDVDISPALESNRLGATRKTNCCSHFEPDKQLQEEDREREQVPLEHKQCAA